MFITRLSINDQPMEVIINTRLLGTIIQDNFSWDLNTEELVRKAYANMGCYLNNLSNSLHESRGLRII